MFLNTQNSMELLVRLVVGGTDGHLLGGLLFALKKHKEQNQTHCAVSYTHLDVYKRQGMARTAATVASPPHTIRASQRAQ